MILPDSVHARRLCRTSLVAQLRSEDAEQLRHLDRLGLRKGRKV